MKNIKKFVKECELKCSLLKIIHRIIFRIYEVVTCFFKVWPPYLKNNFRAVRYLPQWFYSLRPKANPIKDGFPFMPYGAIEWFNSFLGKEMNVFEWGSGGSTIYIAKRVKKIISIEYNEEYYRYISGFLKKNNLANCEFIMRNPDDYCGAIGVYPDDSFDLVIVDGIKRAECVKRAINKVRKGGYLLLDNSNDQEYVAEISSILEGWRRKDFSGPKNYKPHWYQTTIWQRL